MLIIKAVYITEPALFSLSFEICSGKSQCSDPTFSDGDITA